MTRTTTDIDKENQDSTVSPSYEHDQLSNLIEDPAQNNLK